MSEPKPGNGSELPEEAVDASIANALQAVNLTRLKQINQIFELRGLTNEQACKVLDAVFETKLPLSDDVELLISVALPLVASIRERSGDKKRREDNKKWQRWSEEEAEKNAAAADRLHSMSPNRGQFR